MPQGDRNLSRALQQKESQQGLRALPPHERNSTKLAREGPCRAERCASRSRRVAKEKTARKMLSDAKQNAGGPAKQQVLREGPQRTQSIQE
jgi:hypothetical protein